MKNPKIHILAASVILTIAALACGQTTDSANPTFTPIPPTEDIQATVNARIQATMQIEANMQATIDAAVSATATASQALTTLEQLSQNVDAATTQFEGKGDEWVSQVQSLLETRAANSLNVPANQIPAGRAEAIAAALDYVHTVRGALADNDISLGELQNIAPLGVNAVSGLQAQGGPALGNLADAINAMTAQAVEGQFS